MAEDKDERVRSAREAQLKSYYDGLLESPKYASERQLALKQRVFDTFDALLKHRGKRGLGAGASVLDLGSADGAFVEVCRRAGLDARGLDVTDGLDFEVDKLPVSDASIDVVTGVSLIEHLGNPANMLRESMRVLKPGGAIILVTPNWVYSARAFFDDPTHVHPYTPRSMTKILSSNRFGDVYVVPWLVKKPAWMWDAPNAFAFARWCLPFRGDAPAFVPEALRGRSASILAMGVKPSA